MVSLFTASQQSGADHPPYKPAAECPGYDNPSCCTDTQMQYDPLNGQMVDTALTRATVPGGDTPIIGSGYRIAIRGGGCSLP